MRRLARLWLVGFFLAMALVWGSATDSSAEVGTIDLTGTWQGNDGGTYYIRQVGDQVWWLGEQSPTGPTWSNVAFGRIEGNTLRLEWADVPKGEVMSSGVLRIVIDSPDALTAAEQTGNFGGSAWTRQ